MNWNVFFFPLNIYKQITWGQYLQEQAAKEAAAAAAKEAYEASFKDNPEGLKAAQELAAATAAAVAKSRKVIVLLYHLWILLYMSMMEIALACK